MIKKISLILTAIFIFAFSVPAVTAQEKINNGYVPFPVDLSYLSDNPPKKISSGHPLLKDVRDSSIPSKYDLRDYNYVTSVKNQNPYGTCWAFAAIGAMESNYLMQGGEELDLSEMHLAWYRYKNSDKSKAFKNLASQTDIATIVDGGNSFYPAALYTRLDGPVLETSVPYGKAPSAANPEAYERVLRLRDVYYLSFTATNNVNSSATNRQIIKQRIMENGAVVANYDDNQNEYKQVATNEISYYTKGKDLSHAVLIIGWDDNYSKDKFKTKPSSNGAWLIKSSWGDINPATHYHESNYDGCFWMSYEQYLTDGSAFVVEKADDEGDLKAYYYDALGWCGGYITYPGSTAYAANVFQSERSGEMLNEVAFFTADNNVNYEISIYTGMNSMPSSSPLNGTAVFTQTGAEPYAGYHTVTLEEPVKLTKGEYFSVVIKFTGTNKIPYESVITNYSNNATIEPGSFVSSNGTSWQAGSDFNTCVRAFTVTASNVPPNIMATYLPDGFLNTSYTHRISASGSRPLKWTVSAGALPKGLELKSSGVLSGTPVESGDFTFTVTIENTSGTDTAEFILSITDNPEILTSEITGYVGYAMNETIELSSSKANSWSITSGTLPKGLSFNSSTGTITGKPKAKGTASLTVKATSSLWEISKTISLTIEAKPTKPTISTSKLTDGEISEDYSATIKTKGTETITLSIEGLPSGLSMNSSGVITGTPTVAGTFTMKVTAENIYTQLNHVTVTKNVKLKIKAKAPVIVEPSGLPMAIVDKEYEGYTFTLSAGTAPITWTVSGLPKGMKIEDGKLSGTPTKAGNFKLNIKAANSGGKNSLKVPLTVYQIPTVTTTKLSNATTGKKYSAKLTAKGTTPITSWDIKGLPNTLEVTTNTKGDKATISGIPTSADSYDILVTASNAAGISEIQKLTLIVKGVAPKLKASLAKGEVDKAYTGSQISATGTLPVEFSYEIKDSDKTKFGINALSDIGLSFSFNANAGTAEITGTPNQSIKGLPIYVTASNVAGNVTKKLSFTVQGTKPSFTSETLATVMSSVNSPAGIQVKVTGSPKITISMNKVNGFTLTQIDDYTAKISGTAPAKAGKTSIKVTASNADGKTTKTIVLQTAAASDATNTDNVPNVYDNAEETKEKESEELKSENEEASQESETQNLMKDSGSVKFGAERSIKSLGSKELDALKGYTVAAVLPELIVTESGMYDFEVDLEPEIEADKELHWFAFAKNREENSDDEIAEFFDTDGKEITKTAAEHKILISVWLNAGDVYEPVIAVKDSE